MSRWIHWRWTDLLRYDVFHVLFIQHLAGADPGFSWGRGDAKDYLAARSLRAEPNSLSAGVQGPLKGPESSGVVLMLSRAI